MNSYEKEKVLAVVAMKYGQKAQAIKALKETLRIMPPEEQERIFAPREDTDPTLWDALATTDSYEP